MNVKKFFFQPKKLSAGFKGITNSGMAGMFLSAGHHEKRLEFEKKMLVSINLKSIGTYLKMCLEGNFDRMND